MIYPTPPGISRNRIQLLTISKSGSMVREAAFFFLMAVPLGGGGKVPVIQTKDVFFLNVPKEEG